MFNTAYPFDKLD
jgi:aminopeptidase N